MTFALTAWNNSPFIWSQDLTNWAAVYPLSTAVFEMQIRNPAASNIVALAFSSNPAGLTLGAITFSVNIFMAQAPLSAVKNLSGNYEFDFGFIPLGGSFIRIDGGTVTFQQGVTR